LSHNSIQDLEDEVDNAFEQEVQPLHNHIDYLQIDVERLEQANKDLEQANRNIEEVPVNSSCLKMISSIINYVIFTSEYKSCNLS
jgi:FtsZ-binding cell division protein ZapB